MFRILAGLLALFSLAGFAFAAEEKPGKKGVEIKQLPDRLRIELNGQLFTEYFYTNVPRPYCYPLIGPGGAAMTRNWPMESPPSEQHDHKHHRSLWFAHGAINGHDFWSEDKDFGKTVHDGFIEIQSGTESGVVRSRNIWLTADGKQVCTDQRTLRVYAPLHPGERMFDFEITLYAGDESFTLGDTKEGSMAMRVAETMTLKSGGGHIINSEGVRDNNTWGKRADWCDYYGSVDGKIVGVAIFDHPQNPRHPTWWHVRDYGLFAANPFGQHDFEKLSDKGAGNLTVQPGKSVTFRYRFYLHEGDERQGKVAERYREYVNSVPRKL
jgi:hypothetical protein